MQQVKARKQQKPRKAGHKENTSHCPSVPFHIAKASYFIYNNTVHSVAYCKSDIFKSAVLKLAPHWMMHDTYGPVLKEVDDVATRWYLLCSLCEDKRGMKLYATLEDAEEVIWQMNKLS